MVRSSGSSCDVLLPKVRQHKAERGEQNVRRELDQMARRRRFVYNAAVNPPDDATWARARARRIDELGGEPLATVKRLYADNFPVRAEYSTILGEAMARERGERLVFQQGVDHVLEYLRWKFPNGTSPETKLEFMEVQSTAMDDHNIALFGLK